MVLLESPLGGAVERQNRNCSVHTNRGDSPTAFTAVPALEMLVFNPCHTLIHSEAYFLDFEFGWNSRQRQETEEGYQLVRTRTGNFTYYALPDTMSHDQPAGPSN